MQAAVGFDPPVSPCESQSTAKRQKDIKPPRFRLDRHHASAAHGVPGQGWNTPATHVKGNACGAVCTCALFQRQMPEATVEEATYGAGLKFGFRTMIPPKFLKGEPVCVRAGDGALSSASPPAANPESLPESPGAEGREGTSSLGSYFSG